MGYIIPYITKCQAFNLLNYSTIFSPAFPYSFELTAMPVCRSTPRSRTATEDGSFSAGRSSSSHSTTQPLNGFDLSLSNLSRPSGIAYK
jgi:hypothetical protein